MFGIVCAYEGWATVVLEMVFAFLKCSLTNGIRIKSNDKYVYKIRKLSKIVLAPLCGIVSIVSD